LNWLDYRSLRPLHEGDIAATRRIVLEHNVTHNKIRLVEFVSVFDEGDGLFLTLLCDHRGRGGLRVRPAVPFILCRGRQGQCPSQQKARAAKTSFHHWTAAIL
jgi:hypothetical protein